VIGRLITFSLQHPVATVVGAAGLLVWALVRGAEMPMDVFPDLTAPRVTVVTESPGRATQEIERLIGFPIQAALTGVPGVERLRSASSPGLSVVHADFGWEVDPATARQRVVERLQGLTTPLPPGTSAPLLAPASSVMGEIAFVALSGPSLHPRELRRLAEAEVKPRILALAGVSQVLVHGGEVKQLAVLADPYRMADYGLTLADLVAALEHASHDLPGGVLVDGGQQSVVRVLGRARDADEVAAIPIADRPHGPVRVRDVARVEVASARPVGTASAQGTPAVMLAVVKQPEADTRRTTTRLDELLAVLEPELAQAGAILHRDIFRQQDFIDTALANVIEVLRDGAILVVLVLFIFLGRIRPTLISALAIPLSLGAAVGVLGLLGLALDTMTLGGLAIAIGELVDDAIVDVENVERRLREREALEAEKRPTVFETVLAASTEVRSSIVSATAVIMLVFAPLLVLESLEGRLLRPLAIAYLLAVGASLVVAVTITPALAYLLLPWRRRTTGAREPLAMRLIGAAYRPILERVVRWPVAAMLLSVALMGGGVAGLLGVGRAFLPEFNEGSLTIQMVLRPGASLSDSDALAGLAEQALLMDPGVVSVGRRTGRAERDEHALGPEMSELEVRVRPHDTRTREALFLDLRERLKSVSGAEFTLGQPISHRIEHLLSGQRAALTIKLFGERLDDLRRAAEDVEEALEGTPGLVDLAVEPVVDIPQVDVAVDAGAAALYGLSSGEAATAVSAALLGVTATRLPQGRSLTEVVVKADPRQGGGLDGLGQVWIPTPGGVLARLESVARITPTRGPNYLPREDGQQRIVVTANVAGADSGRVFDAVRARIDALQLPEGVRHAYAGTLEREAGALRTLWILGALVVVAIGFIVAATLKSARRALIVLVNLPLALAGGVVGVHLAGGVLSVATLIGFIALFGIATRNGILLATRMRDLELAGAERTRAAIQAARERLAPILMTAVTAALGLLPLGLGLGRPGSEIQAPMALVILGGLATSTVLNMLVVPALLARWGGTTMPNIAPTGLPLLRPDN
jgi:CzcA family heavy metal efflux pump